MWGLKSVTDRITEQFRLLELDLAEDRMNQMRNHGNFGIGRTQVSSHLLNSWSCVILGLGKVLNQHRGDLIVCTVDLPEGVPLKNEEIVVVPGNRLVAGTHLRK